MWLMEGGNREEEKREGSLKTRRHIAAGRPDGDRMLAPMTMMAGAARLSAEGQGCLQRARAVDADLNSPGRPGRALGGAGTPMGNDPTKDREVRTADASGTPEVIWDLGSVWPRQAASLQGPGQETMTLAKQNPQGQPSPPMSLVELVSNKPAMAWPCFVGNCSCLAGHIVPQR